MCGIAGIYGLNGAAVDAGQVKAMCDALIARGPDDEGYYVQGAIGLGMRRLSIVDLANGQQPIANEDGTVQVVLNGEIYNFRELRRELEGRGHRFSTASDTEVIVHLYEEYGDDCVHHLRGMFAFAVWDAPRRRLLVARDRLGIKPLFHGVFDGKFIFASELKALLQLPWVPRDLDWGAVANLFAFMTTPRDQSILSGIHKLEPGHRIVVEAGKSPQVSRYWDVRFETDESLKEADFIEGLRERLTESVRLRMICDVPFGAFLSGGIDSSAVVATMSQLSDQPIKTFTVGFEEQQFSETRHARVVAEAFGTDHHELVLKPDVISMLDDLAWHVDEPFGDSSAIPTYMVSRLAAEHVKVVLSGDGGDELFGGYESYCVERRERRYRHIPAFVRALMGAVGARMQEGMKGRNFLRHIALDGAERYTDAGTLFDREEQQCLFQAQVAEQVLATDPWGQASASLARQEGHWLSVIQEHDLKNYLPLDILTKVDRMSMANSLEARVPLLDHKLVEFAATIPPELRLRQGNTKYIFKEAMRGILPDGIIDRPKQGFAVPLNHWFRGQLDGFVRDLLLSDTSRGRQLFNTAYIEKLLRLHAEGRPLELNLWTLVSFELWCRRFLDQPAGQGMPARPARAVPAHQDGSPAAEPLEPVGEARTA
ncbi:MAG: asparagine synthase (glutamine-hydrolyzing) [Xanthomonadales bacterium]|jgi:asparagine synthase (glutamine-hydrolysing)|nr:asparagine synthase (glutamine-hydrolyzing) [Xanthomonadales bacterium]